LQEIAYLARYVRAVTIPEMIDQYADASILARAVPGRQSALG
jgi:hypothetical protein